MILNVRKKYIEKHKPKIVFIQPAHAHYRTELFRKLDLRYEVLFVFLKKTSAYPGFAQPAVHLNCRYLNYESNPFWIVLLIKILISNQYDIIISSNPGSIQVLLSFLCAKIFKKKHILWSEQWYEEYKYSKKIKIYKIIQRNIARYIAKNSDSVVVPGTSAFRYYKKIGIQKSKIFMANQSVRRYVRNNQKTITKDSFGIHNKFVILYLSRIIPFKGLDILIKAFKKIENTQNDVFLMVGGDGPFKNFCEELSDRLGIKNIKFLGSISKENVYDYYIISDIFVLPSCENRSKLEAWGLVINEAMHAGLPIITTDAVGAAADLVRNGINGYTVRSNSPIHMYTALKNIVDGGSQLMEYMGKNSLKIINKFNDYEKMFNGFQNAIDFSLHLNKNDLGFTQKQISIFEDFKL